MLDALREAFGLEPGPKLWTLPIRMYGPMRVGWRVYRPGAVIHLPASYATWLHRNGYGELQLETFSLPMQRGLVVDSIEYKPVW
jgi:hypothetical protein